MRAVGLSLIVATALAAGLSASPALAGGVDGYAVGPCITNAVGAEPFVDVDGGQFYSNAVGWAFLNEITTGTDDTHFSPADQVTRAQFATLLWRMMCEPAAGGTAPFLDLVSGAFYRDALDWLWGAELTTGKTATLYAPDDALSRAEFATFLYRLVGEPAGAPGSGFDDVLDNVFYTDAVDWLLWRGLTTGTSPTAFSPEREISRAEAVTFLYRLNYLADGIIDPADLNLGFSTVLSGLSSPVAAAPHPTDGSIYIVEQGGDLLRVPGNGSGAPDWGAGATTIWSVPETANPVSGGEQGFLGVAVAPDGGHIYMSFNSDATPSTDAHESVVWEYALSSGLPTGSPDELFRVAQFEDNHNGGHLTFGPDGYLYLTFGDGGGGGDPEENGQDTSTILGSIVRVDPAGGPGYTIPGSNPFAGKPGRDEIYLFGVRNPWKFSFDTATGDLWVADVGQSTREELNRLEAPVAGLGANLGWNTYEGTGRFDSGDPELADHIGPVYQYATGGSEGRSVTGGFVYRGAEITGLNGTYLWADFVEPELRGFNDEFSGGSIWFGVNVPGGSVASFVQDLAGEVYAISRGGSISKIIDAG